MSDTLLRAGTALLMVLCVAGAVVGWLAVESKHYGKLEGFVLKLIASIFGALGVGAVAILLVIGKEVVQKALVFIFTGS